MAVKTNITINIVEPGSDVPVPDTGLFTHGIGGTETTIIVSAALVTVLVILSIVLTTYMYRKHKKQGRTTKLVRIVEQTKTIIKSKKRTTAGLAAISLLVSACTFTAFMLNTNNSNTNAIEGEEPAENNSSLTVNASDVDLTIEVGDEPVFAVLPVQVTVEEATQAGYTLTAYTDNTDLVSTTNPNNKIPMVTVEGDELTSLQDNTWGLALDNEPTSKDNKVYKTLSTDQDNLTLITDKDYEETPANDTTTIYYGFYITPDIPYGTYTNNSSINYNATAATSAVIFNGNGLYFNNNEEQITNIMEYAVIPVDDIVIHSSNVDDDGNQNSNYGEEQRLENITISGASTVKINIKYSITADTAGITIAEGIWDGYWETIPENMVDFYSWQENLSGEEEHTFNGDTITIYSESWGIPENDYDYGYYIAVTGYDTDGNIVHPTTKNLISGTYSTPNLNVPYIFLGWSEDKDAMEPKYTSEEDIEKK